MLVIKGLVAMAAILMGVFFVTYIVTNVIKFIKTL